MRPALGTGQATGSRSIVSLKLCEPAGPAAIPALRHAAVAFAAEHGAGEALAADVGLAVSEAVTNAVKHANAREGERVTLAASAGNGWLEIRVIDRGTGFGTEPSDGLGLGLAIIARLSGRLEICQEGRGTELRMGFPLPRF